MVPVAFMLLRWRRQGRPDRSVLGSYLVLAGLLRFVIEFVRVNERALGPLTVAHLASLLVVAAGAVLILSNRPSNPSPRRSVGHDPSHQRARMTMVADHGRLLTVDEIAVSKFKATCLAALERVRRTRRPLRVTRFGKPLADVMPPAEAARGEGWLGAMRDRGHITGDLVAPVEPEDAWDPAP